MPRGVKRSDEQKVAELEKQLNELKAKIAARSVKLTGDEPEIQAIKSQIATVAADKQWSAQAVITAVAVALLGKGVELAVKTTRKQRSPKTES